MSSKAATPIAIVGMGAIFPGRGDVTGFWRDVFEGRDLLSDVPSTHWLTEDYYDTDPRTKDKTYGRRGGFIDPVAFDPLTFGIPPKAMEGTDTAQLLALVDNTIGRESCMWLLTEAEKHQLNPVIFEGVNSRIL